MHLAAIALMIIGVVALRKGVDFAPAPHPITWSVGLFLVAIGGVVFGICAMKLSR